MELSTLNTVAFAIDYKIGVSDPLSFSMLTDPRRAPRKHLLMVGKNGVVHGLLIYPRVFHFKQNLSQSPHEAAKMLIQ